MSRARAVSGANRENVGSPARRATRVLSGRVVTPARRGRPGPLVHPDLGANPARPFSRATLAPLVHLAYRDLVGPRDRRALAESVGSRVRRDPPVLAASQGRLVLLARPALVVNLARRGGRESVARWGR